MREIYIDHGTDPIAKLKKLSCCSSMHYESWYDFVKKQWFILELTEEEFLAKEDAEKAEKELISEILRFEKKTSDSVVSDIEPYISPTGSGVVGSRMERREDLKRSGCREVDPSEHKATYKNERFKKKYGIVS